MGRCSGNYSRPPVYFRLWASAGEHPERNRPTQTRRDMALFSVSDTLVRGSVEPEMMSVLHSNIIGVPTAIVRTFTTTAFGQMA